MASFWEPEEFVGGIWHRLVGDTSSYPHHPQAAVRLEEVRTRLGRAVPGAWRSRRCPSRRGCGRDLRASSGPIQRLGLGDGEAGARPLRRRHPPIPGPHRPLPRSRGQRGALRVAGRLFRPCRGRPSPPSDPLQADLARLRAAHRAAERAVAEWPGLRALHETALPGAPRHQSPGAPFRPGGGGGGAGRKAGRWRRRRRTPSCWP